MITVFLVDDHELVRHGIASVLEAESDLTVVGEAATVGQAEGRIEATRPDVVIVDARLPDGSGIDLWRRIHRHHPRVRCLILSAHGDEVAAAAAREADAAGYLLKTVRSAQLVRSVRAVAAGRKPARSRARAAEAEHIDADPRFTSLSLRERQILSLIAHAQTNRQIGERLGLAEKTVKNYVSTMLGKLGLEHRTQAAVFELERRSDPTR